VSGTLSRTDVTTQRSTLYSFFSGAMSCAPFPVICAVQWVGYRQYGRGPGLRTLFSIQSHTSTAKLTTSDNQWSYFERALRLSSI
jgi:hypothetical protein